jgi:hypothetical protein
VTGSVAARETTREGLSSLVVQSTKTAVLREGAGFPQQVNKLNIMMIKVMTMMMMVMISHPLCSSLKP